MLKNLVVTIVFVLVISDSIISAEQLDSNSIRIEYLENRVQTLSDTLDALGDTLNFYKGKIRNYEAINEAAKLANDFLERPIRTLFISGAIIVVVIIFVICSFLWILKKTNPKWFTILIQNWVEKYEEVNMLKRDKSILVISSNDFPNEKFIKRLFDKRRSNFQNVTYTSIETAAAKLNEREYNIIFANNEDKALDQENLEKLIAKHKYAVLFYFGKSLTWDFNKYSKGQEPEFLERINFANSRAQVYGNLLSSMKFHDTLI